jgi:CHAT domain-containing protein
LTASESARERLFENELVSLNTQIGAQQNRPQPDKTKLNELQVQLAKKRLEFEDFQVRLYSDHPLLRSDRGKMQPASFAEIGDLVPDSRTAMIEFSVSESKTLLFVISRSATGKLVLKTHSIDIKQNALERMIDAFRIKTATGNLDFVNEVKELYHLLLGPAEAELKGKTDIVVVPDGVLWGLPFQALQDGSGKYLVEKAAVSYAPSLTALREMRRKADSRRSRRAAGAELVAFGNPVVGGETKQRVQRVFMGERLEPLPEAERLVNELGKMYGAARSKVFTGAAAREETAKREAPRYRIVQFATHGILNDASPMYSHLVLARDEKDPNEDGLLEAWELKDLDLDADMVILSACDTARGRVSAGEGVVGMTWAAFIAEAPTTVATQWKVESASTTELMLEFHRQLLSKQKISKAEALRRAGLKLLRSAKYRHPAFWAAFVLVGDGS